MPVADHLPGRFSPVSRALRAADPQSATIESGVHPTYKHLEDRIRLGGLTLGQWTQLMACGLAAYALSTLLPLPGSWSLSVAVTVCGLPAAAAIAFMNTDFDVLGVVRAAFRSRRTPGRFTGGAAGEVHPDPAGRGSDECRSPSAFDPAALWD